MVRTVAVAVLARLRRLLMAVWQCDGGSLQWLGRLMIVLMLLLLLLAVRCRRRRRLITYGILLVATMYVFECAVAGLVLLGAGDGDGARRLLLMLVLVLLVLLSATR